MRLRLGRRCLGMLASGAVCILTANCAMPDLGVFQGDLPSQGRPVASAGIAILARSTPFTLRWSPAPQETEGAVSGYRVYYRPLPGRPMDDGAWVLLGEVAASADPCITVGPGAIPDGVYEMAVSAVGPGGESALHRSSDATAVPSTGWALKLQRGK